MKGVGYKGIDRDSEEGKEGAGEGGGLALTLVGFIPVNSTESQQQWDIKQVPGFSASHIEPMAALCVRSNG